MGSGWNFFSAYFFILPALYHAWSFHGHNCSIGVFSLMRSKKKEKYEEISAALMNLKNMLDLHKVTIDFEIAAIEALKSSFPNANIKGCFFRFAQANWRKIQSIGLAKGYLENTFVRFFSQVFRSSCTNPEKRHDRRIPKT